MCYGDADGSYLSVNSVAQNQQVEILYQRSRNQVDEANVSQALGNSR